MRRCSALQVAAARCVASPGALAANFGSASLQGKIKSLEQIYLFSLPVKEYQIVDFFLGPSLKDEVMKIMPVQKQTRAGQRTRFKARRPAQRLPAAPLRACLFAVRFPMQTGVGFFGAAAARCRRAADWPGVLQLLPALATRMLCRQLCGSLEAAYSSQRRFFAAPGVRGCWRQQRPRRPGCQVRQGGGHCHPRRYHLR